MLIFNKSFPFNKTDYVIMSGTYNLTPTNNLSLWEDYIIKNLTSNWKLVKKAMIFNCLIKEKNKLIKHYIIQSYPGLKKFVNKLWKIQIFKNQLLKDDVTIIIKKSA